MNGSHHPNQNQGWWFYVTIKWQLSVMHAIKVNYAQIMNIKSILCANHALKKKNYLIILIHHI